MLTWNRHVDDYLAGGEIHFELRWPTVLHDVCSPTFPCFNLDNVSLGYAISGFLKTLTNSNEALLARSFSTKNNYVTLDYQLYNSSDANEKEEPVLILHGLLCAVISISSVLQIDQCAADF